MNFNSNRIKNPVYKLLFAGIVVQSLICLPAAFSQDYLNVTALPSKNEFSVKENVRINLKVTIKEGFHINANEISDEDLIPTSVNVTESDFKLTRVSFPPAGKFRFSFSETELEVFEGSFTIVLNLKPRRDIKPGKHDVSGSIHYQACNDRACFPPKDAEFTAAFSIKEDTVGRSETDTTIKADTTSKADKKDTLSAPSTLKENPRDTSKRIISSADKNEISDYLARKGLLFTLVLIFIGGLALNLTPCVYPLIPITISYFGAQVSGSKAQRILMAVVYVLGMSVTYSVLGLVAALTGGLFGSALQNPVVIIIIVAILIALALSMFGLYEIRIPQSIASFSGKSRTGYFGTALMGLTVGFIAAPCIGPFVLSLLVYVGQLGNAFMGFLLFFILSLGLGFPYIFLAAFSGSISKLPRSGEWMEGVKIVFGFVMVGLALYTAQSLIASHVYGIIFPVFLIASGFYLIVLDKKGINAPAFTKIKYSIAIGSIVWGSVNLNITDKQSTGGKLEWQMLSTQQQIDASIKSAGGRPTMIDFYADWCAQCKELDKFTYVDPKVIELSKKFNSIKVDLTKENKEITDKFRILGLPVVSFMNRNGKEIDELRVTGYLNPNEFIVIMEKALKE